MGGRYGEEMGTSMTDDLSDERTAELKESFLRCDRNGDGMIDYEEFRTLLDNLEAGLSKEESWLGFQAIDTDDDQGIQFDEFLDWWSDR